jgi:hypothetical protein
MRACSSIRALVDLKAFRLLCCELAFFAMRVASDDLVVFNADYFQRFMLGNAPHSPVKFQHLARTVIPHVTFLRARPVQWHVVPQAGTYSQLPSARAIGADGFGYMGNLFVCGGDSQHTARLSFRIGLGLGF